MKALVVEDDRVLSSNICESIKHVFDVEQAYDGRAGLQKILHNEYDVVIMDVMMPEMDGTAVVREVRENGNSVPILILTALDQVSDKVKGLKAGADDYLAKPFDLDELQARLEALVRRSKSGYAAGNTLVFLDLELNLSTRTAMIQGRYLSLHGKQFELLEYLISNKNIIVHKERIFQRVWGFYSSTTISVVEVYASQLRKVLKEFGYDKYLKTVRGLGYILTDNSDLYE
ncbi:MAG: response regulator transcription factor [Oscillospiraceae bacterium]|nr:response regulator transcription factor [Oscillospiraceae bacterium]